MNTKTSKTKSEKKVTKKMSFRTKHDAVKHFFYKGQTPAQIQKSLEAFKIHSSIGSIRCFISTINRKAIGLI